MGHPKRSLGKLAGKNTLPPKRGLLARAAHPWRSALAKRLLAWFKRSARDLPWRRTSDLYAIWISEIMLQQTQVATVIPYWERFLDRFPDIPKLAAANEHEVLRLWEGLGYYRRARQLHSAARQIVERHAGRFPTTFEAVRALPGIGRYTAGAILSIGLDQRLPILEANTTRVLSRLTAYRGDTASASGQKHLWSVAESILPARQCGALNQALMELGSEICTPQSPACDACPVAALCEAQKQKLVARIPSRAKPTKYEAVTEMAVVIRSGGRVVLRRCQAGERWAGLWDFPRFALAAHHVHNGIQSQLAERMRALTGLSVTLGKHLLTLKHGVTRFRITLHCYEAALVRLARRQPIAKVRSKAVQWVSIDSLPEYPLSVTGRKICQLLAAAEPRIIHRTDPDSAAPPPRNRHRSC
jgi:A/G-specific adenine glycosylase